MTTATKRTALSEPFGMASELPVLEMREPPREFRIFARGENHALKEPGTFLFDDEAARMVMEAFAALERGWLSFDYEHGAATPADGQPKPSAGRFKLQVRDGELWAVDCEWTPRAAAMIATREYELFSPWFSHEKDPPYRVTQILNVALTNTPALKNARPLVAASATQGDDEMDKETEARLKKLEQENEELRASLKAAQEENEEMKKASRASDKEESEMKASLFAVTGKSTVAAALGVVEALKTKAAKADELEAAAAKEREAKLSADFESVFTKAKEEGVDVAKANEVREKALKFGGGKVSEAAMDFATSALSLAPRGPGRVDSPAPAAGAGVGSTMGNVLAVMNLDPKAFSEFQSKRR